MEDDLVEIKRRLYEVRARAAQFRERLGDLVAPLKGVMAELDEIEAIAREEDGERQDDRTE